jgi:16S rRNA (adenine1518-N6/adenine1519-N6)-dimethyltransferase
LSDIALSDQYPYAKKSFGQNFLVDRDFISKIIDAVAAGPNDTVIEIGPGRGALTEALLDRCERLTVIELDKDLIPALNAKFGANKRFELIAGDVLKVDFSSITPGDSQEVKLVANLPYYISTAVLFHLLPFRDRFSNMVLMFQREVVDRMTAAPATSERGFLTVIVEAFFTVEKLFDVPPSAFRPTPKVWSSVARLRPKADIGPLSRQEAKFEKLVGAAFRQKRKTILNNLKSSADELRINDPTQLLSDADIEPKRRAETLTVEEWTRLFSKWISLIS